MSSNFIRANAAELAESIVETQYALQPQVWKPYGSPGRVKSARDTRYHLDYLTEALEAGAPELFTAYISWVKVLFASLNFPDTVLPTTLNCARQVLSARRRWRFSMKASAKSKKRRRTCPDFSTATRRSPISPGAIWRRCCAATVIPRAA